MEVFSAVRLGVKPEINAVASLILLSVSLVTFRCGTSAARPKSVVARLSSKPSKRALRRMFRSRRSSVRFRLPRRSDPSVGRFAALRKLRELLQVSHAIPAGAHRAARGLRRIPRLNPASSRPVHRASPAQPSTSARDLFQADRVTGFVFFQRRHQARSMGDHPHLAMLRSVADQTRQGR